MKTFLSLIFLLLLNSGSYAQQMRYFEFITNCGYNEWRDTSFIAATSDQAVIDSVLADLTKPVPERKLIIGTIAHGNGGYNRNASYWFSWHFTPNQWHLQEVAMEVCDGCPYSDITLNTTYWVDQLQEFCPWSSSVAREVTHLVNREEEAQKVPVTFFPNPANNKIAVSINTATNYEISILNQFGKCVKRAANTPEIEVKGLAAGLYILSVTTNGTTQNQKLVIE